MWGVLEVSVELILNLLSAVGGLGGLATVIGIAYWLGRKFTEIDYRFRLIDERFKAIDARFEQIDKRFDELRGYVDKRIGELKDYVDKRIDELRSYVDKRFGEFKEYVDSKFSDVDKRFSEFDKRIGLRFRRFSTAFTNYQEFFIEFLAREGVVKNEDREILIKEARRVMKLATANPLTKEEWARLKELFEKSERNELTLEEADEFLELARKVALEYGEYPEAWKLHIYATITRALTIKKHYEKKEKEKQQQK
jgi:hypothetical protein